MSSKTTKAQRRAAKLNRRSKDYRRQIAAQARKEEQAKKPAKKQTMTSAKAKNPNPKKQHKVNDTAKTMVSETVNYDKLDHYRRGIDLPMATFMLAPNGDVVVAIGAFDWDGAAREVPSLTMGELTEFIAEDIEPNYRAAFSVTFPKGAKLEAVRKFVGGYDTINYFDGLLRTMVNRGMKPLSSDIITVEENMTKWRKAA